MASIKLKFRTSSVQEKEGRLYYQVIHNRVARQIHTLQLLAYYIAINKDRNVDQPRNLAKSVTVE